MPVVQGYGLAETSPLTHFDDPSDWRPGSVGRPVADTEARVVDVGSGAVLGPGELGEVQVRGPQVMLGYRGEAVPSCIDAEGWLATGDIGQIDATGRLCWSTGSRTSSSATTGSSRPRPWNASWNATRPCGTVWSSTTPTR